MNGNHPMTEKLPTIAFLFPGQGSQSAGMGKELAATYAVAREVFDEADEALGYKLSELCFDGPDDQLRLTEITQPAILTVSIAAFRVLASADIHPGLRRRTQPGRVLGARGRRNACHLPMPCAPCATAASTCRRRSRSAKAQWPPFWRCRSKQIEAVCKEAAQDLVCQPANVNSPDQIVISGAKPAIERAAELCKQKGAKRAIMLPVSAPFHCAMMQPAQDRLSADLHALMFRGAKNSGDVQHRRPAGDHRRGKPRCPGAPGHRHGAVGALDPQPG